MLLCRENPVLSTLEYPVYVIPKLDGIRCVIKDGVAYSRTLKPIPNKHIQNEVRKYPYLHGADGELIIGHPASPTVYRDTNSFVMSHDKVGEFSFYMFDIWNAVEKFETRYNHLQSWFDLNKMPDCAGVS